MNQGLVYAAAEKLLAAVTAYFENGEDAKLFQSRDLADCVLSHAAAGGVAAMAAGVLPGAGSVISAAIATGAIWRMYIKVCQIIGVSFGKNKLKAISSAVLTNLITQLAGIFAMQVAASFIPGAGLVIVGVGNFTVTYFAGLIFLNVLTKIFQAKRTDIEEMSNEEWVNSIKMAFSSIDKKAVLNEAKNLFMQMRKDGSLDEAGKNIDISTEEDN